MLVSEVNTRAERTRLGTRFNELSQLNAKSAMLRMGPKYFASGLSAESQKLESDVAYNRQVLHEQSFNFRERYVFSTARHHQADASHDIVSLFGRIMGRQHHHRFIMTRFPLAKT
jgi:hypothetical protein